MKRLLQFALAASFLVGLAPAQQPAVKVYPFRGTVEQVDLPSKRVRVANEPVAGVMGAMTMTYTVDKDEMLGKLKPGDRIAATYDGASHLSHVEVVTAKSSDTSSGMSLAQLEQLALAGNPTMSQAQANLRVSEGLARQAGLYPNPIAGYYGDEIRGGYTGGGKQGGFISQTIVTGGKLRAARRLGDLLATEAKTNGELQRLRILTSLRLVFYQVLAAQRLVEVRQKLCNLAADAVQTSQQLTNVGQADRPDVLQAEIEHMQAGVALRIAQQNVQSSWRTLAAVVGKPELPVTALAGELDSLPALDYNEWLATTLRDSPEMKLAQQAIERADAKVAQASKARIPDLQLYGNLTQNNELLETTHRPVGLNGGVQIGVQLPLFNRNQGNIAAAKAEKESAEQEVARKRLQMAREVAVLFRDYDLSRTNVDQYKNELLPRANEAYQLYRSNYEKMSGAYPQVLIAQRTLFQLEVDYVQSLQNAWQSLLTIRGFGLVDGLAAPTNLASTALPNMVSPSSMLP
jgi:cobalt-zinc-cadmium efflux system outer membrane protein